MRIFSGIFGLIILALVVSFALSNREEVSVLLWPIEGELIMPVWAVGLAPLALGIILGGVLGGVISLPHRMRAKRLHKELGALNDKIIELQKASVVKHAQAAPKKTFWGLKI